MQHKKIVHTVLWLQLKREAKGEQKKERLLASFLHASITAHKNFSDALGYVLASKLAGPHLSVAQLTELIADAHRHDKSLANKALLDLAAILERDPAVHTALQGFLYLKGFHALQAYRVAHYLWKTRRHSLAYYLQSRISEITSVDIHPAAKIGYGVMMDHATGVVIGETTGLGNNVSMLHGVTLGGTGKDSGNRHPKIGDGVLLGTGCHVLGNIKIGKGAKIAAGSVVLEPVAAHTTVAGVPAKVIGRNKDIPGQTMNQNLKD